MELGKPEQNEAPPKYELNGLRRGHFCRLMDESGSFIWAAVRGRQGDVFFGIVEHSDQGGPSRGTRIAFTKYNVFEIT